MRCREVKVRDMTVHELPATVVKAWGAEVAHEFVDWLDHQLHQEQMPAPTAISAFVARQKVNVLMLEQVSNLLLAGDPVLESQEDGTWVWRVPVDLTLPGHGRVGQVGFVNVDAQLGRIDCTDALLEKIAQASADLVQAARHSS